MIIFRKSTLKDIDQMVRIAADGKALLKSRGIDQWQKGPYPGREIFEQDVKDGIGYVLAEIDEADSDTEADEILAICAVPFYDEPTYRKIENGEWLTSHDALYGTIQRFAVAKEHQGRKLTQRLFDEIARLAKENSAESMRVTTHPDNTPMRNVLARAGFTECGVVYIFTGDEEGALRLGFERLVE